MKYYIFDFDGVLADTFDATNQAKVDMEHSKNIKEAALTTLSYANNKPLHSKNVNKRDLVDANKFTAEYAKHIVNQNLYFFDLFIKEIEKIENKQIAIVSSGPGIMIRKMLRNINLNFTHVLCYEDHHSKEEKVNHICSDWNIDISNAYYFTDTKTDIWELSSSMNIKNIIGCAWGHSGYEKLSELLPDNQILKKFRDIHNL